MLKPETKYPSVDKQYMTSEHIVYSCQYHVIFCPKYRRKVLTPPLDSRLKEILYDVAEQNDFRILDIEVMPDHVQIIVDCNPRLGICRCVKMMKGTSSRILRKEFPSLKSRLPCLWTRSYFVSSVGAVTLDVVKRYIDNQKNK